MELLQYLLYNTYCYFYTRLNSFLLRAVKLCYYDKQSATITDLFVDAVYNKEHVLHTYLPEPSDIVYTLRTRQHKNLIPKTSNLKDRHFLIRLLYKDCYSVILVQSSLLSILFHALFFTCHFYVYCSV